jgi:serine/threonine-protein kinase
MIPGTDEGVGPFFSPDGKWIGYWAIGQIRKVPLKGGPPVLVIATPQIFGASWDDDDRIVFARGAGGLLEVASAGGSPRELTTVSSERAEVSHRLPNVVPGGDAILFTVTKNRFPRWDETEVWVHSRRTGASKRLIEGGADARYVSSGHLLYAREGALLASPFDLNRLEITGGAVGVVPDVMQAAYVAGQPNDSGATQVSVSGTGTLVYVTGGTQPATDYDVMQVDRTGRGAPLPIPPQDFRTLRLSPDGSRIVLSTAGRDRGIWLYAFDRGTFSKLTSTGRSSTPVWTPDGERITYSASMNGPNNVHWIRADGGGAPELLVTNARNIETGGWTPDGRELLYYEIPSDAVTDAQRGPTIWAQDVAGKGAPRAVTGSVAANTGGADVSPDGRWLAYQSAESGRIEVYVDAFPGPGPRFQVSTNGGGSPIWRKDGRELFYVQASNPAQGRGGGGAGPTDVIMMAVSVTTQPALAFGPPRQLFAGRYSMNGPARGYDVTGDGQRFLLLQARERAPDVIAQMSVVQNWIEGLK